MSKQLQSLLWFFFSKVTFRKYLITTMFKVLYQQLRSTFTDNGIWKTPCKGRFYGHRCQDCTKAFNLFLYASLSLKKPSFFWYNLFTFLSFYIVSWSSFSTSTLFSWVTKFSWASMLFFCEGLQLQIVVIFFIFSMKH